MKKLILIMLVFCGISSAQEWNAAQTEVWNVVLASYADIEKQDANWSTKWVTEDAMVWGGSYPMPRSRDAVQRWDSYQMPQSKTMMSNYSPTAIVVHGSTAVAHYYYSSGDKNKEGKHKTTHGRCSDVLAKTKAGWKFVAWHCSDES
ncbi:nuclear transport factor 2 family protein [Marinicella rhabdoformis]|uniref:nuclear transport factor 2 family protein n=1 Tax=Marinicella rhabdoformis TaxID=2580566 RepID=UPI0012AEBDBA|nr:nuclear transport factor 2 family protein [Marinicella rhabdoformis]